MGKTLAVGSLLSLLFIGILWMRSRGYHWDQAGWVSAVRPTGTQIDFSFQSRPGHLTFWYESTGGVATDNATSPGAYFHFQSVSPPKPGDTPLDEDPSETPGIFGVAWNRYTGTTPVVGDYFDRPAPVSTSQFSETVISISYWLLAMFFCISPALFAYRNRRRARAGRRGLCMKCGYDLRATPQRCPECGASKSI